MSTLPDGAVNKSVPELFWVTEFVSTGGSPLTERLTVLQECTM